MNLFYVDYNKDDPKKCTAKQMRRFNLATEVSPKNFLILHNAVLLWPFADTILSHRDRERSISKGIALIDTSWKLLENDALRWHFKYSFKNSRKLPPLIAANAVSYGKIGRLSSAEAFAAALFIIGEEKYAIEVVSKFKWGDTFISLNQELLARYKSE